MDKFNSIHPNSDQPSSSDPSTPMITLSSINYNLHSSSNNKMNSSYVNKIDSSTTTVQADLNRAGRETLNRFPLGTTLIRPDLISLINNLSISQPTHPHSLYPQLQPKTLLEPYQSSLHNLNLNLVNSTVDRSTNWGHGQQVDAEINGLIESNLISNLEFKSWPIQLSIDEDHSSNLNSNLSNSNQVPSMDSKILSSDSIKSFYQEFLTKSLHHYRQQLQLQQQPSQNYSPSSINKQQQIVTSPIPSPVPIKRFNPLSSSTSKLSSSSSINRQESQSPDPLAMNLLSPSKHPGRKNSLQDTPTPLSKKRRKNQANLVQLVTTPKVLVPLTIKKASLPLTQSKNSSLPQQIKINVKLNPPTDDSKSLSQFTKLIEDILEADDMLMESSKIFCQVQSELILSPVVLTNLKLFVDQTNGKAIETIPIGELARLIKILERGVKFVEDLNIIPPKLKQKQKNSNPNKSNHLPSSSFKKSKVKKPRSFIRSSKTASNRKVQQTPSREDQELAQANSHNASEDEYSDDDGDQILTIEERFKTLMIGLHSVDTVLAIFAHHQQVPKQLYSEELIRSLITGTKNQLLSVIFPFVEANEKEAFDVYSRRLNRIISQSTSISNHVASTFSFFSTSILPKIDVLLGQVDLSESILINLAYIAISPFFVDCGPLSVVPTSTTKRKKSSQASSSMKNMRLECLKILRNISSKYPDQRSWIVDEILVSVANLPDQSIRSNKAGYHLTNGKSIQTVSALLLHIVQCCRSGARERITTILSSDPTSVEPMKPINEQVILAPVTATKPNTLIAFDGIKEYIEAGLSVATKLTKKIITFFIQKSGKTTKSTHETHYRVMFDRLIEDLINLLFLPDWPVAEFMLGLCCKTMMTLLESNQISADANAIKSMCLDHLGPITARLMEPTDLDLVHSSADSGVNLSFKAMVKSLDRVSLSRLFNLQNNVLDYLNVLSGSDDTIQSAADFVHAQWILELINALKGLQHLIDNEEGLQGGNNEGNDVSNESALFIDFQNQIETMGTMEHPRPASIVARASSDHFTPAIREGDVTEMISKTQGLKAIADLFLERILVTLASSSATFRSKAIKALALVVAKDETVFFKESVRQAIGNRMLDSSPAVRDATIELVGKYVVNRPDLAVAFLPQISARVADKGVSVRRRVVKLLKSIYLILDDDEWISLKVDISHRLISRIHDEENSMRDLAMNAINELWFSANAKPFDVSLASSILMKVTAGYKDLPSPVEAVMKFIMKQYSKKNQADFQQFTQCCQDVVEHLIDQLMDVASTARDSRFSEVECIKTICILTFAYPKLLAPGKALMLLPYLKGATTLSEQMILHYLLKIFRACASEVPKSSDVFGKQLQTNLLVLVNKPNLNGGGAILQELIACFCAVVIHQTRDYSKLLSVFKACEQRLQSDIKQLDPALNKPNLKALPLLMYLASTLVSYGKLDQLPSDQEDVRNGFKAISLNPVHLHVYNALLHIYKAEPAKPIRNVTLTCLGFIYRAYPSLMTRSESIELMDNVFKECSQSDLQHRLLKLIVEFISSQNAQMEDNDDKNESTGVDMNQLIGNTEGFADSGVASAIVQRYLGQITTLAQSIESHIQKTAVDIISFTIKQGLAHPLECVPVLVALEGSPDQDLAKRVFGLHMVLHVQRANLVHSRFIETMGKVYEYHAKAAGSKSIATGYLTNPTRSVMGAWYQLLNEKRTWRTDFLKTLIKSFSLDPHSSNHSQKAISFHRYLAEGLITLDFKSEEEVMLVIESINENIGQSAYHTLHLLQDDPLKALLGRNDHRIDGDDDQSSLSSPTKIARYHCCIVLGIGFVLRDLVKELYAISDQKLDKFRKGLEKKKASGSKSSKEGLVNRRMSFEEVIKKFAEDLIIRVPGLDESLSPSQQYQRQLEAFEEMLRDDREQEVNEDQMTVEGLGKEDDEDDYQDVAEDDAEGLEELEIG
ncbi:hypothetical protein O181_021131 [Austropuccinia psidii MF-1]|uniref:Sister chromatid cohesion protein n=1 Tax=Austropuccinia psidii MF-1 TaxID=1389203 RepID=A0A9Q3CEV6_9BASI|nr:hypothetical protein [Austropuccinia psidii MF-1]